MSDGMREQLQQTLGTAFTVDRELGGGGMSRVFVATDTTLDRQIVVKLVPSQAAPSVSIERFKREIKVAAKLQHPHIVPVLSAGESGGLPFYTMPYVAGESLRHRLAKGGELSVNETVHVLRDVAAALAYAHAQGVVHRDIKPENVLLSGGVAVVTDFGVAKAMDLSITDGGHLSTGLTSLGVALGTPAYMSPEQATADPHVDHRSDIYSFGCVAYEMLTGASPFAGRAPQQLLAAHVQDAAEPIDRRRPSVPPALATLVMRCLAKRPGDRPQSVAEVLVALDGVSTPSGGMNPTSAQTTTAKRSPNRGKLFVGVGVLAAVGIAAALVLFNQSPDVVSLQLGPLIEIATGAELEQNPAISPDGKYVAYSAGPPGQERIYVRQLGGGRTLLTGDLDGFHNHPKWSPDGSTILFVRGTAASQIGSAWFTSVHSVPMIGGTPRLEFEADSGLLAMTMWSPDGTMIAYGDRAGLRIRPVQGGAARMVVSGSDLGAAGPHSPSWSPDGRYLAFLEGNPTTIYNISVSRVVVVDVQGGKRTDITDASRVVTSVTWTPDGDALLYVSNRNGTPDVFQQAMRSGKPVGQPIQVTTGMNARTISLSADGLKIAYDVVKHRSNVWSVAISTNGTASIDDARALTNGLERVEGIRISHDGAWVAYDSDRGGNPDIYKNRVGGGEPIRLTSTPENEFSPAWSPDDREIAFHVAREGNRDIEVISANGADRRPVTRGPHQDYWPDWSADGRSIGLAVGGSQWQNYVTTSGPEGWTEPKPVGEAGQNNGCIRWAPSGSELASSTDNRLMLHPVDGGKSRTLVDMLTDGESVRACAWGLDGRLYFNTTSVSGRYSFWSIAPNGGAPRLIMRDTPQRSVARWDFDTDGRRLFFSVRADESDIWVREIHRTR